jgi:hypothetical protein
MVYESNGEGRGAFAKLPDASMPRKSDSGNRFPERKEAGTNKERKSMGRKWLDLGRWRSKQAGATATAGEGSKSSDRNSIYSSSEKEKRMTHSNEAIEKASAQSAREVSTSKVDLVPMEDIYQAAGIMDPRRGYSIGKVVEMIHSDHMRGLSKELKQAAVLMALEAAGISVEQVQQDAKIRKNALDTYEAAQRKQVEAVWARKAEEVIQIQAELESVKAHLQARISRNLEGVAREKETFNNWLTLKQRECESMAEAVEMCVKVAAVSGATPSENAGESAKEKGVAAAKSL